MPPKICHVFGGDVTISDDPTVVIKSLVTKFHVVATKLDGKNNTNNIVFDKVKIELLSSNEVEPKPYKGKSTNLLARKERMDMVLDRELDGGNKLKGELSFPSSGG